MPTSQSMKPGLKENLLVKWFLRSLDTAVWCMLIFSSNIVDVGKGIDLLVMPVSRKKRVRAGGKQRDVTPVLILRSDIRFFIECSVFWCSCGHRRRVCAAADVSATIHDHRSRCRFRGQPVRWKKVGIFANVHHPITRGHWDLLCTEQCYIKLSLCLKFRWSSSLLSLLSR